MPGQARHDGGLASPAFLQLRQPLPELAQLDRSFDHARVERRIVVREALHRIGTLKLAGNAGGEHFEMAGLANHAIRAGFEGANRGSAIGAAND